jgi:hypothetical protein
MGLFDSIKGVSDAIAASGDLRHVDPQLMANGLAGTGRVTSIESTRMSFGSGANADPVVAFELEVRLPDREPYAVAFQQRVPHLLVGAILPGTGLAVRVDPADAQRVAVDFDQPPVPAGSTPAQQADSDPLGKLERLAKLHEQGVITDAELAEQKQRLLGEI